MIRASVRVRWSCRVCDVKACLEGNLVPLGKGILSDELHNLVEVLLLLQDLTNLRSTSTHLASMQNRDDDPH
jgi:hypothetical protein